MSEFIAKRVVHEYSQINCAPPEQVFPLLCPVREAEWVPGWEYRMIYSESGIAELGCIFATPNDDGSEAIWVVTDYDPPRRIAFVWVWPQMVATRLEFSLIPAPGHRTCTLASYCYTGLSPEGNTVLDRYDAQWFEQKMRRFEEALNRYITTGEKATQAWE